MGKIILIVLLNISFVMQAHSQYLKFNGLETYNLYLQNPALVIVERHLQLDMIGYTLCSNYSDNPKGYLVSLMASPSRINSSFRFSYEYESYGFQKTKSILVGYSYRHSFSSNLSVMVGGAINPYKTSVDAILAYPGSDPYLEHISDDYGAYNLDLGMGLQYKSLQVGLSSGYSLFNYGESRFDKSDKGILEYEHSRFFGKYKFTIAHSIHVIPQFYINHYKDYFSDKSDMQYSFGIHLDYKDKVGVGVVNYDSVTSFIGAFNLIKRVRFLLVLYDDDNFLHNDKGWNLMGQVRVNI